MGTPRMRPALARVGRLKGLRVTCPPCRALPSLRETPRHGPQARRQSHRHPVGSLSFWQLKMESPVSANRMVLSSSRCWICANRFCAAAPGEGGEMIKGAGLVLLGLIAPARIVQG